MDFVVHISHHNFLQETNWGRNTHHNNLLARLFSQRTTSRIMNFKFSLLVYTYFLQYELREFVSVTKRIHSWQFLYFLLSACSIVVLEKIKCNHCKSCEALNHTGILALHMMGGLMYFCGLKMYPLCTFLGQETCCILFQVLKNTPIFMDLHLSEQSFCRDQWIRKLFILIQGRRKQHQWTYQLSQLIDAKSTVGKSI